MTYQPNHTLRKHMTRRARGLLELLDAEVDGDLLPAATVIRCIRILEIELAIHGERAGR